MTVVLSDSNPYAGMPKLDAQSAPRHAQRLLAAWGHDVARSDASGFTAAFARQLEYVYPEVSRAVFSQFKARKLIPVDNSVPNTKEFFTYNQLAEVAGAAAIDQVYADDAPRPTIYAKQFPQRIVSLTSSYGYSFQDLRAAADTNFALDAELGRMAKEMHDRQIENLAAVGTPLILQPGGSQQMYGLLNAPGINATTQISTGDWITQYNADVSAGKVTSIQAMLTDLQALRNKIPNQTKNEMGDSHTISVVWPTALYNFLNVTPRNQQYDGTGQTLLQYFQTALGFKDFDFWNRVDAAGASNKGRVMAYVRDPSVLRLVISQEFEQFAPQPKGFGFVIPCHSRTGAVQVRMPLAMTYMDGISP